MAARSSYRGGAGRTALVGLLTGLSLICLYLAFLAPSGKLGVVALAGIFPAGAVVSANLAAGFFCYAATGILGLLLIPAKSVALLYLIFFGLWPMVKSLLERLPSRSLEWVGKLACCNLGLAVLWFGLKALFLPFLPAALGQTWMVFVAGNVCFVIYDVGFSKLIAFYAARVDRVLRKNR